MENLYHQTNHMLQELQGCFVKLERSSGESAEVLEKEIQARIDQITSNCERLEILVHKEPPARRQNAKLRVDQLKYDNHHLQAALRTLQSKRMAREREHWEREELLRRSFTTNQQSGDTSIHIDYSLQHHTKLKSSSQSLDYLVDSGANILESLRDQGTTLKGTKKKILDIANTLGMSNTVMRLIERRTTQDKFIFYGGVIVTLVIVFLALRYLT